MFELVLPDPTERYNASWAPYLNAPKLEPLDQWLDGRLYLPREMSPEPGYMRLSRTPYLREIFAALSDPQTEEVVLQCGTQLGKSTVLLGGMAQVIAQDPSPAMLCQPTIDLAKRFSRQRVATLIRANAFLSEKMTARTRDGGNTVLLKEFIGGILVMSGANSAASLASMPAKWLFCDEIDDWPLDVDGQGDPGAIVVSRQDSFGTRARRAFVSSPKRPKGAVGIESRRLAGTDEHCELPCPHCGEFQELEWGGPDKDYGIKWTLTAGRLLPSSVAYLCKACKALIPETAKPLMLERNRWVAHNPGPRTRSFHLSSLYSPLGWLSWRAMAQQWLRAQDAKRRGDSELLQAFINTRLAQTWEEGGTSIEASRLKEKAEDFRLRFVPSNALVLLAAVDVQDDRFEIDVWAIGLRGAMWTVDTIVIMANPALEEDWGKVDEALKQRYDHEDGFELGIEAVAVDTGGHYTHEAYGYVRSCDPRRNVHAIKGADKPGQALLGKASMVDVNSRSGAVIQGGVKLWHIGVHSAKDRLFGLMRATTQQVHFSTDLDEDYFKQLTAEHRVQMKTARGTRFVWVKRKGHARNERLDCAVYVIWLAEKMKLATWPPSLWDALRKRLEQDLERRLSAQSAEALDRDAAQGPVRPTDRSGAAKPPQSSGSSHVEDTPDTWF